MSDNKRELVELAAKAAGYKITMYEGNGVAWIHETSDERFAPICWCPMYDHGDALRLAVKLGLRLYCLTGWVDDKYGNSLLSTDDFEWDNICLAIVRAAAEIGRKIA